jgi:Transcriptional Coactivator p15 (PC4)
MAKAAAQDRLVGSVSRSRREELRVSVRQANGVKWLDIRVYYESESGTMLPSPRGVSLSPNEWTQLRDILQRLHREKGGAPVPETPRPLGR